MSDGSEWVPFGDPGCKGMPWPDRPPGKDKWDNDCGYPTEPGIYDGVDSMYYDDFKEGEISAEELEDYADDGFEVRDVKGLGLMCTALFDGEGVWTPVSNIEYGYWRRAEDQSLFHDDDDEEGREEDSEGNGGGEGSDQGGGPRDPKSPEVQILRGDGQDRPSAAGEVSGLHRRIQGALQEAGWGDLPVEISRLLVAAMVLAHAWDLNEDFSPEAEAEYKAAKKAAGLA